MKLTKNGYFLITIRKTITLHLWSEDKEFLLNEAKEEPKKKYQVVESFKDESTGYEYILVDGKYIKLG